MDTPITQEQTYGCGVACFTFVTKQTYPQAAEWLGPKQATSNRFYVKGLRQALNSYGLPHGSKHVKQSDTAPDIPDGSIVLVRRSNSYPVGHYFVRRKGQWMDPWINMDNDLNITNAASGYRKTLPGRPMYVIYPAIG